MGYKTKKTIRVNLAELGDNNGTPFYVEIKNPKVLTFDQQMAFAGQASAFKDVENLDNEKLNGAIDLVQSMIVSWNLIDIDTEQPLNLSDKGVLKRVPGEVLIEIFKTFGQVNRKVDAEQKNSSEPSDKSLEGGLQQEA